MDKDILLHQLENLVEMLGIEIRYETIENEIPFSPGGLCRLGDRYVLIINKAIRKQEKIQTLGRAVTRFDLSTVYLRPGLRAFLSQLKSEIRNAEKKAT
ncbi:MAG: hypothetical protein JRI80_08605 [Deltaproteobacteria bacterium]|nr:hypothetical protein [Deltaproteobacteria bacterium]